MESNSTEKTKRKLAVHLMAKPTGPACNLDCEYCFYLEKEALFPEGERYRMSDEVLEAYIRKSAEFHSVPELLYAWQGGEPTMMGVDFFRKAIELEKNAVVFYLGMKDVVANTDDPEKVERLVKEEMGHITLLSDKLQALED